MKNQIKVNALASDEAEILIYGQIGDAFFDEDAKSAGQVRRELAAMGDVKDITVRINSPGGNVFDGAAIYNLLKDHPANVLVKIDGLAASAASMIAMAGDLIVMPNTAQMMIHDPWMLAMGNSRDMRKAADVLDEIRDSMLHAYTEKTGLSADQIKAMLEEETWMGAAKAKELGFVDEQTTDVVVQPNFDMSWFKNAPKSLQTATANAAIETQSTQEVNDMTEQTNTPDNAVNADEIRAQFEQAENKRRQDIRAAFGRHANNHRDLLDACLDDSSVTVHDARARLLDDLSKDAEPVMKGSVEIVRDESETRVQAVVKALSHRADASVKIDGDDPARKYVGMRLSELARSICQANNIRVDGMSAQRIAQAALSTSDFPLITENMIGKSLRDAYDAQGRTFTAFSRQVTMPDFKEVSRVQLGEAPQLDLVQEGAEYTYGSMSEAAEKYRLFKYGRMVHITWETLINDDLTAFTRIPQAMGAQAAQKESEVFYAHLTGNPAMHDGVTLFHADHGNLAGTGAALSVDTLGAARAAMRKQTGVDGKTPINVFPEFLLVPAAIETDALQLMAPIQAAQASNANPYAGQLQVITESRLDTNSATAWYAIARPAAIDTFEHGYLEGEVGPQVETEEGFSVDGLRVKVRHSFAAKAIDWRGVYKNAGA